MRKNQGIILSTVTIAIIVIMLCAVALAGKQDQSSRVYNQNGGGNATLQTQSSASMSDAESLQFMVEEEKLAHDVYTVLHEKWGTSVFSKIANSETKHESKVAGLLSTYGVQNPASDDLGVFTNQELQSLYDTLVEKGMQSEKDALEVGVMIEKEDIKDLQAAIDASSNTKIKKVYSNLLTASEHHLEHFESLL